MRAWWLEGAAVVAAIVVARPALGDQPSPSPVLRTELGIGSVSLSTCRFSDISTCDWSSFSGTGVGVLGATYDSPIGSTPNLSLGGRLLWWEAGGARHVEFEPSLGVTWKFPLASWLEARLHVGGGLYLGTDFGLALRLGAGLGVSLSQSVSLGVDGLLEAGVLAGNLDSISTVTLGPAFRL
jgi:hypothetical protein